MSPAPFTAAVVQAGSVPGDTPAAAAKAARLIAEAAGRGARLIVFPEAFLGGYPKGASFGAPVGMRRPEGRAAYARYFADAVDMDGPELALVAEAAAAAGAVVVIGVIERAGGTLYCTAVTIDGMRAEAPRVCTGGARGVHGCHPHRKLMPTAAERLIWGFGDGSTLAPLRTDLGTVGSVICWENYMPALRLHMYSQGVDLYCAPTADDRDTWLPTMRHIALEGRCFVLSACQHIRRRDFPQAHESAQGNDPGTVMMRGGSCIIGPLGEVLAGPHFEGETILTAEIDMSLIAQGKYDFDAAGHYARPDVFALTVDTRPKPAVQEIR